MPLAEMPTLEHPRYLPSSLVAVFGDLVPIGLYLLNTAAQFVDVNAAYCRLTGYTREELRERAFTALVLPHERAAARAATERALRGDLSALGPSESRRRRKDGSVIWTVEKTVRVVGDSGQPLVLVAAVDITASKLATVLRPSLPLDGKPRLPRAVVEILDLYNNAPCGHHSLDDAGLIVRINDTELAWLGYSRDEVVGRLQFADLLTEASREAFERNYRPFAAQGSTLEMELDLARRDGSTFPALCLVTAVRDQAGNLTLAHSALYDLSVRRQAHADHATQVARLDALLAATRELHASLELGTTLQSIVQHAARLSRVPVVRLFLLDPATSNLCCEAEFGPPDGMRQSLHVSIVGNPGLATAPETPTAIADVEGVPEDAPAASPGELRSTSTLGLPIQREGRTLGVLVLYSAEPRTFGPEEVATYQAFADRAATAIENARVYRAAREKLVDVTRPTTDARLREG